MSDRQRTWRSSAGKALLDVVAVRGSDADLRMEKPAMTQQGRYTDKPTSNG